MTFDERYRVIESRDPALRRAVRHGGALDRHLLPAELPGPHAQALERHVLRRRARPRTRPATAPASAACPRPRPARREWNLRGDTAGRAMRLIADGVVEREGVPGLARAARLLAAPPHPAAHRRARRRAARAQPRAPRADGAHAARRHRPAGRRRRVLGRVRQRPAVQRHRPRGVRHAAARAARAAPARDRRPARARPGAIDLALPHRGPLDAAGLFALDGARAPSPASSRRPPRRSPARCGSPGGPAWFELRLDDVGRVRLRAGSRTSATCRRSSPARGASSISMPTRSPSTRRWRGIPSSRRSSRAVPGIRVPGAADPHEMLIRAMVGQQITVAAARTALTALTDALGERASTAFDGADAALPDDGRDRRARARGAARSGGAHPRDHRRRGRPRRRLAAAHHGRRRPPSSAPRCSRCPASARGPPTTCACACSATPTCSCPGDVAVRAGAAAAGIPAEPPRSTAWAARTAPWRSYLTAHLWRAPARARHSRRRHAAARTVADRPRDSAPPASMTP